MATILRITSKRAGFRRAGIEHPATPTDHPIEAFTPEQLAMLKAETIMLTVEEIEVAKSKDAPKNEPPPVSVKAEAGGAVTEAPPVEAVKAAPKPSAKRRASK